MGGLLFGYASARPDVAEKLHHFRREFEGDDCGPMCQNATKNKQLIPLRKQVMADTRKPGTFKWLAKNNYPFTPSEANHFLLDVKQPGGPVINALAHQLVMIGRTWAIMPNWPRVTKAICKACSRRFWRWGRRPGEKCMLSLASLSGSRART